MPRLASVQVVVRERTHTHTHTHIAGLDVSLWVLARHVVEPHTRAHTRHTQSAVCCHAAICRRPKASKHMVPDIT